MRSRHLALASLFVLAIGCSLNRPTIVEGSNDGGLDAMPRDATDVPLPDVPFDAPFDVDPTVDAPDAGVDAPTDSGVDAPTDTGVDAPIDPCSLCTASEMCCGGVCVDVTSDPAHCGSCSPCPAADHATPACAARMCGLACDVDFADCNTTYGDGCEADLGSLSTCNACGNACIDYPNTNETCAATGCRYTCAGSFRNCNLATPECEADIDTDPTNCGGCGQVCGTDQTCVAGGCHGWRPLSPTSAPSARVDHVALWTGTEMIIWGGRDDMDELADGALYNPATNTWRAMSSTGAPGARRGAIAVWTGSQMIVWSGYRGGAGWLSDGGVYTPATNTWTALMATGTPTARSRVSAAWTGSTMVFWGGWTSSFGVTNTGASWAPGDAAWNPTPGAGGLAGRAFAGAVWTGSRYVLWGGDNRSGTRFQSGARFDPVADTWTGTTTTGAPSARTQHAMVWVPAPARAVVWGGLVGGGAGTATGGAYDPVANTWTSTSASPLAARLDLTAVGTTDAMLAWGGRNRDGGPTQAVFGDGALYAVATDSWTALSTAGAPSARYSATAVWTGSEMIVFGGLDGADNVVGLGGALSL